MKEPGRSGTALGEPAWLAWVWTVAVLLTAWSFGFTTMQGSDLWWHLAGGRWICQTRTFDFVDSWSFTRHGLPWYNPEWLSQVVFHVWASVLGMTSLVWWKWAVLGGAFFLLFRLLRQVCGSSWAAYLAMFAAAAVGSPFFDIRPQLYTVLGFVAVLAIVVPLRRLWLLPAIFLLWSNLHSGFILGLVALTIGLAAAFFYGETPRRAGALWLSSLAACLINPSGPRALLEPFRFAAASTSPFLRVGEWKPPFEPGGIRSDLYVPALIAFGLSLIVVVAAGLHRKNNGRAIVTSAAIGLVTLVMSLRSRRFIPLFGIAQALLLAPALTLVVRRVIDRASATSWWPRPRLLQIALAVAALLLGSGRLVRFPLSGRAFLYLTAQDSFPVEAMNFVEVNQLAGKVFNFYEWGGYVGLRSEGRLRVFIDGRAGLVFDEATYRRYLQVLGLARGWEDVVWNSDADFVLWPKRRGKQIEALRASGRWRALYSDRVAILLVRAERFPAEAMRPTPDSPWRELSLGWAGSGADHWARAEEHFKRALDAMPNLRSACEGLANVQAKANRMADAEATLDRCQRMFPDPDRRRELLAFFRARPQSARDPDDTSP